MSTADRSTPAEYVIGLCTREEHDALSRAGDIDPALSAEIDFWTSRLSYLDAVAPVAPPPDLFSRIQARIASRSQRLPGTMTVRAEEGIWEAMAPGIERKRLWDTGPASRATFLVRMAPGARYDAHGHDDDEECYVVSGDITFDTLTLGAGDYHLARRGIDHPPASSRGGCLLLITAAA